MQDRPGGLVRAEPEFALDLHRADAVLGGRDQPGGMEPRDPFCQGDVRHAS